VESETNKDLETFKETGKLVEALGMDLFVFDTETTGLVNPIGIVEISGCVVDRTGKATWVLDTRLNPGFKIPIEASNVHGIFDHDVANCQDFRAVSSTLAKFFETHAIGGYNSRGYDVPVVFNNTERYNIEIAAPKAQIDVRAVWCAISGSMKGKLVEVGNHYGVEIGQAHSAKGDVQTSLRVLESMIKAHSLDFILDVCIKNENKIKSSFQKSTKVKTDQRTKSFVGKKPLLDPMKILPSFEMER